MGRLFWEAIQRSTTGPIMAEEKFETELLPSVLASVQAKYKIEADPDEPVMADPDMADAVFQAGMELLLELGLYCQDTKRIIKFTEEEIKEAIATARHEVTFGQGRDEIRLTPRAPGDAKHPYCWPPAGTITRDVDIYRAHALTVVREPTCDGVFPLPLFGVGKTKNIAETPAHTLVCLTEARIMNDVATWAGRPGLFFGIPMSATTPITLMSTFNSGLYNKYNCTLPVQILMDMRVNYDRFNLTFFAEQQGLEPWMSSSPTLYAYLTGPEQVAIEIIAHTLGMLAYSGGTLTQGMSVSVHGVYSGNDITWSNSAAALAAEQNLRLPWLTMGGTADPSGPMSDSSWYGTAVCIINACISGMEATWLSGGSTGLEARWAGELSRAAAALSPREGIEIIKKANAAECAPAPPAATIDKLYDMSTLRPIPEFVDHYKKFTRIFKEWGLDYPSWDD